MNDHMTDAQIALRRKDNVKLSTCIRSLKKAEKQLIMLACSLRQVSKSPAAPRFASRVDEAELSGIVREVIDATASASMTAIMGAVAGCSATLAAIADAASSSKMSSWISLKRRSAETEEEREETLRRNAMEKLEEQEKCIGAIEMKIERVFRCLINTRVTLLGLMTP